MGLWSLRNHTELRTRLWIQTAAIGGREGGREGGRKGRARGGWREGGREGEGGRGEGRDGGEKRVCFLLLSSSNHCK
jgi:hypothetical protein